MTKKDYKLLVRCIVETIQDNAKKESDYELLAEFEDTLKNRLKEDNPNFSFEKWDDCRRKLLLR